MKLYTTLATVYCLLPPTIEHARHSALPEQATFDLDATVQYHCHTGYVTNGFPRAKCLAIDGQASWYGPDISCERNPTVNASVEIRTALSLIIIIMIASSVIHTTPSGPKLSNEKHPDSRQTLISCRENKCLSCVGTEIQPPAQQAGSPTTAPIRQQIMNNETC
ncbi:hypothetical protein EVAR_36426_1 [Eumeta japonica]|uniref:Sushi domain-containing protein n=1 Tax=Eumeta variegata TaxID=151549 RepID=A0A4C1VQ76_EUMVA|nr:hypothetical protein EVAR_36426_1 [Eumeta japonica]